VYRVKRVNDTLVEVLLLYPIEVDVLDFENKIPSLIFDAALGIAF